MREFNDLPEEDKVKVVTGIVMAITIGVVFFAFAQLFLVEDRLHVSSLLTAGMSLFRVMRMILPVLYLIIFVPTAIAAGTAAAYLKRRFSALLNTLLILSGTGGCFLITTLLLTLFDISVSSSPVEIQVLFMALAFFIPAVIAARTLKIRKINDFMKKHLDNAH